jgi:hypothetical protein
MQRWTRTLYLGTLPAYYSAPDAEQRVNLLLLLPTIMLFNMARYALGAPRVETEVRWSLEPSPWPNAPLRVGEYARLQVSCTTGLGGTESLQSKQQEKRMQGIWPIRRRWRGSTRCMGMV